MYMSINALILLLVHILLFELRFPTIEIDNQFNKRKKLNYQRISIT